MSEEVGNKWENGLYLFLGDVVYSSDPDLKFKNEFEKELNVIKNYYEDIRDLDKIYPALMKCACRYKHWGFKEENEVRIIAIPHPTHHSQFREDMEADGIEITEISRKHYLRSGALIPYIDLFEDITSTSGKCMPIKRVIVGPSVNEQERKKRIRAVEILLRQYNISNVSVTASEIPYIG